MAANENDYSFASFLGALETNWFEDDALLQTLLAHYSSGGLPSPQRASLSAWGRQSATALAELADQSERPENAPYIRHFDAHHGRVDHVVLASSTYRALDLVQGREQLGCLHGDPLIHYAKQYIYVQNGEAGVGCSIACTDGMVRVLDAVGDRPEHRAIAAAIRDSSEARVVHGAQFVTEIQGGSDVPTNLLRAEPRGDHYLLHGTKWFCSNINADYFLVTGRPDGAPAGGRGVALFVVPAYLHDAAGADDSELRQPKGPRNGYRLDRLKDKLGTRALATAEVTFEGAVAWPVGPLDRGIANVVAHVLVTSRVACINIAAAFLRQAERVAHAYAEFRSAFGRPIARYPLVRETLKSITRARHRTLATYLDLIHRWHAPGRADRQSADAIDFRILVSLAKAVLTRGATEAIHDAMMVLGGNGIEERFSPLPRLLRDAVIMETWEGPHNLLFTQALKDLHRFDVDPHAFVQRLAPAASEALSSRLAELLKDADDPETTVPFAAWAKDFVAAHGDSVLRAVTL